MLHKHGIERWNEVSVWVTDWSGLAALFGKVFAVLILHSWSILFTTSPFSMVSCLLFERLLLWQQPMWLSFTLVLLNVKPVNRMDIWFVPMKQHSIDFYCVYKYNINCILLNWRFTHSCPLVPSVVPTLFFASSFLRSFAHSLAIYVSIIWSFVPIHSQSLCYLVRCDSSPNQLIGK